MTQLALGSIVGFSITAILIWSQRGSQLLQQNGYFGRVLLSAALTAVVGGMVVTLVSMMQGGMSWLGLIFAAGWFIGALLAGWVITPMARRQ